jgi:hypothetical protein
MIRARTLKSAAPPTSAAIVTTAVFMVKPCRCTVCGAPSSPGCQACQALNDARNAQEQGQGCHGGRGIQSSAAIRHRVSDLPWGAWPCLFPRGLEAGDSPKIVMNRAP